ncbi:unnamed protein product [Adineta ricciae]|uniref:Uncharacterized protein n=1 Tax=Adineta ricciae TaxID=249248 RepID=A0A814DN00_ADIRI|nr:unnamed protein product [Adineta ricciae]
MVSSRRLECLKWKICGNIFQILLHVTWGNSRPKVDLRCGIIEVEFQVSIGKLSECTLAGAYECLLKKTTCQHIDVSRLFIYYNRQGIGSNFTKIIDENCPMTNAIEGLVEFGVHLESVWPYDTNKVNDRPINKAYEDARPNKINGAFRVKIDLTKMKLCLAQGHPFAIGLQLYTSFDQVSSTSVVPQPAELNQLRPEHDGHVMKIMSKRRFLDDL